MSSGHKLTFDGPGTVTVNGNSVESGYTLQNGDVIVAKVGEDMTGDGNSIINVNGTEYVSTTKTIALADTDIHIILTPSASIRDVTTITINYTE